MHDELRIAVFANPPSNDHQARILIDGADWLGPGQLGLDPPELAVELGKSRGGALVVGRCDCGCVGCSDVTVQARRTASTVEWRGGPSPLIFDARQYDAEVRRFSRDRSWETVGRQVERELGQLFAGLATGDGMRFAWASTRIGEGLVHLAFQRGNDQRMLQFGWDGETLETALDGARLLRDRLVGQ